MIGPFVAEAVRSVRAQPVSGAVTALVVAVSCGVIMATTGQVVASEARVLAAIDAAGARTVVVTDLDGSAGLTPEAVSRVAALSPAAWAVGLGPAIDVRAAGNPSGSPVPLRVVYGSLPPGVRAPSWPVAPGSALAGPDAMASLGFEVPAGGVVGEVGEWAVVGAFAAEEPLSFLDGGLLTVADPSHAPVVRSLHVAATSPAAVDELADAVLAVLGPADPTAVGVTTSEVVADIRRTVGGEIGRSSRRLLLLVLGVALALVTITTYGATSARRRDFGRRRALGAARGDIVALVTIQSLLLGTLGAVVGVAGTALATGVTTGVSVNWRFPLAVVVLAVEVSALAALPPAFAAARQDPVRILRVP